MEKSFQPEKPGLSEKVQKIFYSARFKIAFAFVLGILIGVFIFLLIHPEINKGQFSKQDAAGTMWDSRPFDQMTVADNLLFQNPLANATFDIRYSTRIVEAHIGLSSSYPSRVLLTFDPGAFSCFTVQNTNVNEKTTAVYSYSSVQIDNVGDNQFVILLYNKSDLPNNINITVLQNEIPMYSNAVTINKD